MKRTRGAFETHHSRFVCSSIQHHHRCTTQPVDPIITSTTIITISLSLSLTLSCEQRKAQFFKLPAYRYLAQPRSHPRHPFAPPPEPSRAPTYTTSRITTTDHPPPSHGSCTLFSPALCPHARISRSLIHRLTIFTSTGIYLISVFPLDLARFIQNPSSQPVIELPVPVKSSCWTVPGQWI